MLSYGFPHRCSIRFADIAVDRIGRTGVSTLHLPVKGCPFNPSLLACWYERDVVYLLHHRECKVGP